MEFRWSDVNWQRRAIRFHTTKTQRHGHSHRTCPIFPALAKHLEAMVDAAEPGEEFRCPLISTGQISKNYLDQRLKAAIGRAGFEPWPRLWNNLRATRATEIDDQFGSKAEREWIGHGAEVALRHYLMVTDEKWNRAVGIDCLESQRANASDTGTHSRGT